MTVDAGDPYVYPGTDVLRNQPGFRDPNQLKQFEYEQTYARANELRTHAAPDHFTLKHLRRRHETEFKAR